MICENRATIFLPGYWFRFYTVTSTSPKNPAKKLSKIVTVCQNMSKKITLVRNLAGAEPHTCGKEGSGRVTKTWEV
jgi:hypothetical protein